MTRFKPSLLSFPNEVLSNTAQELLKDDLCALGYFDCEGLASKIVNFFEGGTLRVLAVQIVKSNSPIEDAFQKGGDLIRFLRQHKVPRSKALVIEIPRDALMARAKEKLADLVNTSQVFAPRSYVPSVAVQAGLIPFTYNGLPLIAVPPKFNPYRKIREYESLIITNSVRGVEASV